VVTSTAVSRARSQTGIHEGSNAASFGPVPCLPFLFREPSRASLSHRCASNRPVHRCLPPAGRFGSVRLVTLDEHNGSRKCVGAIGLPCDAAVRGAALGGALPWLAALPPRTLQLRLPGSDADADARGGVRILVGTGVLAGPGHAERGRGVVVVGGAQWRSSGSARGAGGVLKNQVTAERGG
jgi:hypothetical protein